MTLESDQVITQIKNVLENPVNLDETERAQIVEQLKDLTNTLALIDVQYRAGDLEGWIAPSGKDGRSYTDEMKYALAHRSEGYIPQFTYPALARGYLEKDDPENTQLDVESGVIALNTLQEQLDARFGSVKGIAAQMIASKRRIFHFLDAVQKGDQDGATTYMPHGKPNAELVSAAQVAYQENLEVKPKDSNTGQKLKDNKVLPREVQEYFDYSYDLIDAIGWTTKLSSGSATYVMPETQTVGVPQGKLISALHLLELEQHELGAHVRCTQQAVNKGFGPTPIGSETVALQEGIAKIGERDIQQVVLGYTEPKKPYYVLGIQKAIETNGNFWEVYDYLVQLRRTELVAEGKDEKYIAKNVDVTPRNTIKRIFRGAVDLSKGGYVYTKDKAYLQGEMIVERIKEEGLLGLFLSGKYGLDAAIFLIQNGVITKDALNLTNDIALKIWNNEGDRDFLLNTRWYRENMTHDLYWREHDLTDEEYINGWKNLK